MVYFKIILLCFRRFDYFVHPTLECFIALFVSDLFPLFDEVSCGSNLIHIQLKR